MQRKCYTNIHLYISQYISANNVNSRFGAAKRNATMLSNMETDNKVTADGL